MPGEALAAVGFRQCVAKCQESDNCSAFILQDSGRCFLQTTRPQISQDPDVGDSLAFLKPSCTTFSCGPGATPKPLGSSPVSVSEAACCSCLNPKVPEPGHGSGDLRCVSCLETKAVGRARQGAMPRLDPRRVRPATQDGCPMPTAADVRHVLQGRTPTWAGAHPVLFRSSWKTTLVSCHDQGEKESSTSFEFLLT